MKIEDLHTLKIRKIDNFDLCGINGAEIIGPSERPYGNTENELALFYADRDSFDSEDEAMKAAALFRSAFKLQKELRHLVRLLESLERGGGLNIPGLATLNGARAALALSENLAETVTP